MDTETFWCVWDPLEGEEHLYRKLEDALKYVKELCEGGLEMGDNIKIEHRTIVFAP